MNDPTTLRELLRADPPPAIAGLSEEHSADLTRVLAQARTTQRQELKDAANSLLDLVPGFLRGAVKRAAGI